tara:strand:- start:349 stop:540 length:192 start_codon:yes stop_codon:yes gene_type:complete
MKVIRYPFKEKYLFFFNEGKIKRVNSSIFLKKYIIKRYDKRLSHLSIKEKLSKGVSITDLKLI